MDWDGNIAQDHRALQEAGSEAMLQETRVPVKEALAKARMIAGEVDHVETQTEQPNVPK